MGRGKGSPPIYGPPQAPPTKIGRKIKQNNWFFLLFFFFFLLFLLFLFFFLSFSVFVA